MRGSRMIRGFGVWMGGLMLLGAGAAMALPTYGTLVDTMCTANGWVPPQPFNPNGGNSE